MITYGAYAAMTSRRESGPVPVAAADRRLVRGVVHGGAGDRRPAGDLLGDQWLAGLPDAQEADHGGDREERGDDVGQLDREVVRAHELADREAGAADQRGGPDGLHAAPAVDHADEDQRHEQRQQRRLAADHGAEILLGDLGQAGERDDRDRDRAEGHRRRVGHERHGGGLHRLEAEVHEHRGGDRHRRAEARERLEQRAEGEGDDHGLDPLIVGDRSERAPQHREVPAVLGHVEDPDRVPDDPHDREQPERDALKARVDAPGRTASTRRRRR